MAKYTEVKLEKGGARALAESMAAVDAEMLKRKATAQKKPAAKAKAPAKKGK